jgi:fluoride exporter
VSPTDRHGERPVDPDAPDVGPAARPVHRRPGAVALVLAGGLLGTLTRYGLSLAAPTGTGTWPWGTFVANVAGALVLGALLEALARGGPDTGVRRAARLLVGTGFCGGLTTYSTLAVESALLVRADAVGTAVAYLLVTVLAGVLASVAGIAAAAGLHRRQARTAAR